MAKTGTGEPIQNFDLTTLANNCEEFLTLDSRSKGKLP